MGTSSAAFFRSMGGAVGTAVFISMLFSLAADKIATGMKDAAQNADYLKVLKDPAVAADPANAKLYEFFKNGASNDSLNDTSWLHTANPTLTRPITEGFAQSIDAVMLTAAVLTGIAFLITLRPAEQETHGPEGGRPGGRRGRRPLGASRVWNTTTAGSLLDCLPSSSALRRRRAGKACPRDVSARCMFRLTFRWL